MHRKTSLGQALAGGDPPSRILEAAVVPDGGDLPSRSRVAGGDSPRGRALEEIRPAAASPFRARV
jgi:hypothetical protein